MHPHVSSHMSAHMSGHLGSSSVGYDANALAYIEAANLSDSAQKDAINTFVVGMKAASLWSSSLFKFIYPFIGGSESSHSINLMSPGTFTIEFNGTMTHDANGVQWDGASYGDTNFVPWDHLTQNSEHYSFYSRSSTAGNGYDIGSAHSTGQYQWSGIAFYNNDVYAFINNANSATATVSVRVANGSGLWLASRTSQNSLKLYNNDTKIGENTDSNIWVRSNNNIYVGATNIGSPIQHTDRQMAFASAGGGLDESQQLAFYTLVNALQLALGRAI